MKTPFTTDLFAVEGVECVPHGQRTPLSGHDGPHPVQVLGAKSHHTSTTRLHLRLKSRRKSSKFTFLKRNRFEITEGKQNPHFLKDNRLKIVANKQSTLHITNHRIKFLFLILAFRYIEVRIYGRREIWTFKSVRYIERFVGNSLYRGCTVPVNTLGHIKLMVT